MSILFNKRIQTDKDVSPPVLSFSSIVQDTIIDYGGSATLNSTAQVINPSTGTTASGTINYQWYKDGVPISGANSSTLSLTNQLAAANYYCVASFTRSGTTAPAINSPITSRIAKTTIRNNIIFTKQPQSKTVVVGKSAIFSCSAYPNPKSMSGFNPELYGTPGGFGDADYNAAISQGFSNADIRYYLENVYTSGRIGPAMITRLNDANFGTEQSRNLVYEWYVNEVLTKTTRGNATSQAPGFNGQGIYLDLTDYIGRVLVEFRVTENSAAYHRILIPNLATINDGINARFLKDGYIEENLPNTSTPWGTHNLLLDGGRIYGPITSDSLGSGYLVVAGEVGTGGYERLDLADGAQTPVTSADKMRISVNRGFFRTYVDSTSSTVNLTTAGITYAVKQPPRVKHFSTLELTSSVAASSSVYCKVRQENISGDLAPPPVNSNIATFSSTSSNCLVWDDSRKLGGKINVTTVASFKGEATSTWGGPWQWGTINDTCYILFNIEIRDIFPRNLVFSGTDEPFVAVFECRIRRNGGSGGDVYNSFKALEWNGNRASNASNKQTLRFNTDDFNGERYIVYGDNGIVLFDRTRSTRGNASFPRMEWDPGWEKASMDILLIEAKRKRDGQSISIFAEVATTYTENVLEYGRRFDPYEDPY